MSVISVIFVFIITVIVASDLVFVVVVVVVVVTVIVIAVLLLGPGRRHVNFPFPKRSLPFGTVVAISNNSLLSFSRSC